MSNTNLEVQETPVGVENQLETPDSEEIPQESPETNQNEGEKKQQMNGNSGQMKQIAR